MALINCPKCSHKISDQSVSCPKCGFLASQTLTPPNPNMSQDEKKGGYHVIVMVVISTLFIIIGLFIYFLMNSYSSYQEKVREYTQQGSESNTETSDLSTLIPMSDPNENGRYYLTSHITENDIEHIEYIRKGDNNDSYTKMEIKCSEDIARKYSADSLQASRLGDMRMWFTPLSDWTDNDIMKFICPIKKVVSKNIEHHEVVEKVVTLEVPKNGVVEKVILEQFQPEPVISVAARPREVLLSNAPSGSEKEYKVTETPITTKEPYNEKVVNKAADDKRERDIARRKSDDRAICEQAMKVNSAYLGKDEPEYSQWKAIERANCMKDKIYE